MGVLDDVRQAAAEAEAAEAENAQQSGSESSADSEATTRPLTTPTLTDAPTPKAEADPFAHTWETERFEVDSETLDEMTGLTIALANLI